MSLFFRECRNILKSYIYYAFIVVVLLFYISQMGFTTKEDLKEMISPPVKKDMQSHYAPYGLKKVSPSKDMIPEAVDKLYGEYKDNSYVTYPLGIYKRVKLNDSEIKRIEPIIEEIAGQSIEELEQIWENNSYDTFPVDENIRLERFYELMEKVGEVLGVGLSYKQDVIDRFTRVPITYEEAVQEYEHMVENNKFKYEFPSWMNGYARLFCDYIGIVMGIFPIFVAVFMSIKDNRSKMSALVYSRSASSSKIVLSRYFSLIFMMILPVIAIGIKETTTFMVFANNQNFNIDAFAFIKYIAWWIIPTIMIVTAVGILLTTLTDTPVAILVGLIMWCFSVASIELTGDYPLLGLFIRHNSENEGTLIIENFSEIMLNRVAITGFALLIVIATVFIYEQKRRGKLDISSKIGKWNRFNKVESKTNHHN
ncbi:ABC transporter permease protein [Gottschalkia acidurici 9a]|uniref:ABC transporter permease protein n=1 Tax=Gottschalkia acidurici (strain ATCC 7906 / DSM 604 / BCRC 14475 / CIP 104303 / KCTC 5404 / NCIMB 10678 / 9a) TaxID=1128398 RepID=K0B3L2_GOTA9|nr:ABC transporter permease [Gottschalkia acidurici]AFS79747.1 ABC transporter permease protein [Gottschalkia acidurici 9a]